MIEHITGRILVERVEDRLVSFSNKLIAMNLLDIEPSYVIAGYRVKEHIGFILYIVSCINCLVCMLVRDNIVTC